MTKLTVARTALAALLATTSTAALAQSATPPADAAEDREAMSELLSVDEYILRIQALDDNGPRLNAVIDYDPAASVTARQRLTVGPLHGRTVLVKDNIDTAGFATTAGSLALKDNRTGRDAPLIANLQASGGVVLGKTNLSEWANIRSDNSTSGWSAVGGLTRNPYAIERNTCGSSSGSGAAVAAGFAWGAIGTETNGSITCPASINGIVGFKPSVGIVSRTHVVPISSTQDTAGPMSRTVRDAALLLTAIAGEDKADPVTLEAKRVKDYTEGLDSYSLQGVRIGVMRSQLGNREDVKAVFNTAVADLERGLLAPSGERRPDGHGPGSGQAVGPSDQPVALDPRLLGVAAVPGLAHAPAVQHHPVASGKARMGRGLHYPGEVDAGDHGEGAQDGGATGQGQAVLEVHRRELDPHGDIGLHEIGVCQGLQTGLDPGIGLVGAQGAEGVRHGRPPSTIRLEVFYRPAGVRQADLRRPSGRSRAWG